MKIRLFSLFILTILSFFSSFVCAIEENSNARAQWIWQEADGPNNTWLCFRKSIHLNEKPSSAIARIAAENKYWLYVNGNGVVVDGGMDVRPDLQNTYCDSIDLSPWMKKGENTIAILVWYKGGYDGYSQIMVEKGGLFFDAVIQGSESQKIVSDSSWKIKEHPAFAKTEQQQQWEAWKWVEYPILYDAGKDMSEWMNNSFDDSNWKTSVVKGFEGSKPWNKLRDRTIPLFKPKKAVTFRNQDSLVRTISEKTTLLAELGENRQGYAYLKLDAPAGVIVKIRMNEWYTETYVTCSGVQEYRTYQWQNTSGRPWEKHCVEYEFSNVTSDVEILDLSFVESSYDTEFLGSFECDNERLNTLWEKCANTSLVCMRDIFYDCPDRERGQWWGDVSEQILYSFYVFDQRAGLLAKKGFRELMNTQKENKSLYTTAPGSEFHLPDQNMAAVNAIGDYYLYTGDLELVKELYGGIAAYIEEYLANTRNDDGMLIMQEDAWNWIDWGDNRDIQVGSANAVANALFVRLLRTVRMLAKAAGSEADCEFYTSLETEVLEGFNQYFWNEKKQVYVVHRKDGIQSEVIDDRSNAWAILAGVSDANKQQAVLNILETQQNASPYQERFIEEAMFQMGKPSEALERMLSYYEPDIDSWSTTMWERMGSGSTNNHAWAASPCYLLGAFVAGVRPVEPAYDTYYVMPQMGFLKSVKASVPSPKGMISVEHFVLDENFKMQLSSPNHTEAIVGIPHIVPFKTIRINGVIVWREGEVVGDFDGVKYVNAESDTRYTTFSVKPGTWSIEAF